MSRVLFSTKTWQGDVDKIINDGGFDRKHQACLYPFDEKWLIINNVDKPCDIEQVKQCTGADRVINVVDYATEALDYFGFTIDNLGSSYVYSICELVELYLAQDFDYLCHFASDTLMNMPYDWITPSKHLLSGKYDIITTAPMSQDSWCYGLRNQLFSDQAYMLKIDEWRNRDTFKYLEPVLDIYPEKGGDQLFERRASRYLHNTNKYRLLLIDCWYNHPRW